jgi:predicted membrane-bound spermidine synthase
MSTYVESNTLPPGLLARQSGHPSTGPAATLLACALFVISGACGLAYEVVWSKFLGLFLGNTVLLHTAVLATFMGGLALGSFLTGRRAERIAFPLKAYGWLEIGIAAYALLFPALMGVGQQIVAGAAGSLAAGSTALLVVKVSVAAGLLVLPTLLMGATFPLLTAHVERHGIGGANGANWLYFANCAGAVLGTLLSGFVLIPELGLSATVLGVGIVNLLIGSAAIVFGCRADESGRGMKGAERLVTPAAPASDVRPSTSEKTVLLAICLSGATAFCYELVWTRLFAVTLGSSTYSFTLMLAAFITGLAGGSIVANLRPIRRVPLAWFAAAEIGIGLAIALSIPLYPRIPYWFWQWKWFLRPTEESMLLFHTMQYSLVFLVMALPTFLFGLTFPTAIRSVEADRPEGGTASRAAAVYGWNTVGTIVGVLITGWLLIPGIGLQRTLQVGAALNLAIGALLLARGAGAGRARAVFAGGIGVALLTLALVPRWPAGALTFGPFRAARKPPATWAAYSRFIADRKPVFYREDFGTTVAVVPTMDVDLRIPQLSLVVDGKTDATSVGDMPTQMLVGHIPFFLKPDSPDVFVLGLGSGVTVGSVLTHPVKHVDCVEISRAVAAAARHFTEANSSSLSDPRLHLTIDDGKTFLAAAHRKYDVIISEPTNPWISGVGTLFSRESFQNTAKALKPNGIVAQWFHAYSLNDELVATIVRTFREVFPHAVIFQGNMSDFILVGSLQPISINFGRMEERLRRPEVARDLDRIRIDRLVGLLARQTHSRAATAKLAEGGGLNTDDMPLLEYLAPGAMYLDSVATRVSETDGRFKRGSGLLLETYMSERGANRGDSHTLINVFSEPRMENHALLERALRRHLRLWPNDADVLRVATQLYAQKERWDAALVCAEKAAALGDKMAMTMRDDLRQRVRNLEEGAFVIER